LSRDATSPVREERADENRQNILNSHGGTRSEGEASPHRPRNVKSDATLIRVGTDDGLTGIGAALGSPPIVAAIVAHELARYLGDRIPIEVAGRVAIVIDDGVATGATTRAALRATARKTISDTKPRWGSDDWCRNHCHLP
jgi:hypothetical protein